MQLPAPAASSDGYGNQDYDPDAFSYYHYACLDDWTRDNAASLMHSLIQHQACRTKVSHAVPSEPVHQSFSPSVSPSTYQSVTSSHIGVEGKTLVYCLKRLLEIAVPGAPACVIAVPNEMKYVFWRSTRPAAAVGILDKTLQA